MNSEYYSGYNGRKSSIEMEIPDIFNGKLILFAHGFMGYKDWGAWSLVKDYFIRLGFGFCKFNFSHNGTTPDRPNEFVDLNAFSINSYWKEYHDIDLVLDWITEQLQPFPQVYGIGHSLGGSIMLLHAKNRRIKRIASWAAVGQIENRFPKGLEFEKWQAEGVFYKINGRTKQNMPVGFEGYEDFMLHPFELNLSSAIAKSNKPILFIHGDNDKSVDIQELDYLKLNSGEKLNKIHFASVITGADHTFGSREPWLSNQLPEELANVCEKTAVFFLKSKL